MKFLIKPRRGGKTVDAVKLANETGAYLVVRNQNWAREVDQLYKPNRFPVTYADVLEGRMRGSFVRNIVIDDVDAFIQYACMGLIVEACTMSAEITTSLKGKDEKDAEEL